MGEDRQSMRPVGSPAGMRFRESQRLDNPKKEVPSSIKMRLRLNFSDIYGQHYSKRSFERGGVAQ